MPPAPEIRAHQQWLGYLQPAGLVVSAPALAAAGVVVNKNIVRQQQVLIDLAQPKASVGRTGDPPPPAIDDLPAFCRAFLGWEANDLAGAPGGPELPRALDVALPEYGEVLSPTYGVPDPDQPGQWLMLVQVVAKGVDLDEVEPARQGEHHWHASPQARLDRLLRATEIPIGLLSNGTHLRLVYAPPRESTGHVTFPVAAMCEVPGRPIAAALHMLLETDRLFTVERKRRLPAILQESRRYQNEVSTRLAEQVLDALWELLRGLQAANEASKGELLREVLEKAPQQVYGGLLGTLMRLVFVLYAEDRSLLSDDPIYQGHYSVAGLFERLRDENARFPDTMDQRFGAWAQLLTLFRLIHDGAAHGGLRLPPRHGRLFNPDTWDFLEGRPYDDALDRSRRIEPPRIADGVVYRVLDKLLLLDGERISYRALDVEQIGSVYEAMMGFELRQAQAPSIGVRPHHVVVDLGALLAAKPAERLKILRDEAKCEPAARSAGAVGTAKTADDLVAALGRKVSPRTSHVIPKGSLFLQPTEERRRSGSHYTPRSLTEPIVRTTLEPILKGLGEKPRPEQILDLKVCDPAMGSGAFLVEACRFLGEGLVKAWDLHGLAPKLPPDEDLLTHAKRLVAARCLYGVDKNPFAVDLAKLSLWLATLAKDHPFTFLDHALRHGDSLVGLDREQIEYLSWKPEQRHLISDTLRRNLKHAEESRRALQDLGDTEDTGRKQQLHDESRHATKLVRDAADLVVAAFFGGEKEKDRESLRRQHADLLTAVLEGREDPGHIDRLIVQLQQGPKPVIPFHWAVEFPEVFSREEPGFDAFIGNPPFAGKNTLTASTRDGYPTWLKAIHEESHGNADLIAHFFRRAFGLLRQGGAFGLIATNTIAQGDTRASGLRWICTHGGTIYSARRRVKWPAPGAAVVVSVVHVAKGSAPCVPMLDARPVERVTAFLFHDGGHDDPLRLAENAGKSFIGSYVLGMGFTFDDRNPDATPLVEMERLIAKDPRNKERIFPYIGGEEVNDSPTHAHRRYVINFGEMSEQEARRWPDLVAVVEAKVKAERLKLGDNGDAKRRKTCWWLWGRYTPALFDAIHGLDRVLAIPRVSQYHAPAFLSPGSIFSEQLVVVAAEAWPLFTVLQSRAHELWFRFFGSSLEERPRYTPSDCFETFPFAPDWEKRAALEVAGEAYYQFRAGLMVGRGEGLTKTYGRFHDPDDRTPEIVRLRELHDGVDRAVLDAYGWSDLRPACEFLLDYGTDEAEAANDDGEGKRTRKKPWRYRWPDEFRDAVLSRLLALNQERARNERVHGKRALSTP